MKKIILFLILLFSTSNVFAWDCFLYWDSVYENYSWEIFYTRNFWFYDTLMIYDFLKFNLKLISLDIDDFRECEVNHYKYKKLSFTNFNFNDKLKLIIIPGLYFLIVFFIPVKFWTKKLLFNNKNSNFYKVFLKYSLFLLLLIPHLISLCFGFWLPSKNIFNLISWYLWLILSYWYIYLIWIFIFSILFVYISLIISFLKKK